MSDTLREGVVVIADCDSKSVVCLLCLLDCYYKTYLIFFLVFIHIVSIQNKLENLLILFVLHIQV